MRSRWSRSLPLRIASTLGVPGVINATVGVPPVALVAVPDPARSRPGVPGVVVSRQRWECLGFCARRARQRREYLCSGAEIARRDTVSLPFSTVAALRCTAAHPLAPICTGPRTGRGSPAHFGTPGTRCAPPKIGPLRVPWECHNPTWWVLSMLERFLIDRGCRERIKAGNA